MSYNYPLSQSRLAGIFRTDPRDPLRITRREGTSIEFKESFNYANMVQYFKIMASYANASGGYIVFGVTDSPRKLVGLRENNLVQFDNIKVEEVTRNLSDHFSPEIRWDLCTYDFNGKKFGIIYVFENTRKPCICKKTYESSGSKSTIKEGDIYYRYKGRSERIKYEELSSIIDSNRRKEEKDWLDLIKKVANIGIENACLLSLSDGLITGNGKTIYIDEKLLSQISFIKEGEFSEKEGAPTLRLIGNIERIDTGKVVFKETTKRTVKAIEPSDIIKAFLTQATVEYPLEHLRILSLAASANYPLYYLIKQANISIDEAKDIINETFSRSRTKRGLLERLEGKTIEKVTISVSGKAAAASKREYRNRWISKEINSIPKSEINYCLDALLSLEKDDVIKNEDYIKERLLDIYDSFYESSKSNIASNIRKAICRIDELLNMSE